MPKFRKKPVVIEAEQWFPNNHVEGVLYRPDDKAPHMQPVELEAYIPTLEGEHIVSYGDWIITGVKGEQYPCKPDIFEMTYDPA